jgi:hypothetical protein
MGLFYKKGGEQMSKPASKGIIVAYHYVGQMASEKIGEAVDAYKKLVFDDQALGAHLGEHGYHFVVVPTRNGNDRIEVIPF